MRNAGLTAYFEQILSADSVRRLKPAPEPYLMAADRLGVPPAGVRLVAAHYWDIAGALRVGFAAAFVARAGQVLDPLAPRPDVVGADLRAVADQIIALEAVLMTAFVLMKQNRMSKLADRRAHLDLQINLMTERETTKLIGMLLEIGERLGIKHKMLDVESPQLSRSLIIETLIEAMHSKFPDS